MPNTRTVTGEPESHSPISMQTGLSVALVAVIVAASVAYGRQVQRLDAIEAQLKDSGAELREMRNEVRSLRELLIQRTMSTQTPTGAR